ncbi:fused MFS/spermidine synthase [Motilibacter deserti]|uniref:Methyltransferase domain-containing protein n=1 Tax=Motilibacter deserti TaxID=2714956 RepID=A0ABX0H0V1_9ACTN|nr:fused MFS/spermidine synthase [Motilibacter deserti]NHC15455.1 methyltransferase domain-containing protein [Motilibacter deserti]
MPRPLAALLVLVTSAATLVLEIVAVRLVAPYVGLTLESYTAAIAVALLGIAGGARLGGMAADARPPSSWVGAATIVGGLLVLTVRPLVHALGPGVSDAGGGPLASIVLVGASTLVPVAVLSMVSPGVVKMRLSDLGETGRVVGRLSALGTLGGLAGSVLTGYVLVATLPTTWILGVVGGVLLLLGLLATPHAARLLPATAAGTALVGAALVTVDGPCEAETAYYCAQVVADPGREGGRTLVLDDLRHAYVDLDDPAYLQFAYTTWFGAALDALHPRPAPLRALHIGGGGFTMPRWIEATRPGSSSLVLELDPSVVEIAREELGLREGPALQVRTGDARRSMRSVADDAYDVVVGDAFGSLSVPWHLATRQLVEDVDRVLRPGGTYVANVIDYPPAAFLKAEIATIRDVFDHVALIAHDGGLDTAGGNFVVLASDRPLDTDALLKALGLAADHPAQLVSGGGLDAFVGGADVLTDDYAPVDQLLTPYSR